MKSYCTNPDIDKHSKHPTGRWVYECVSGKYYSDAGKSSLRNLMNKSYMLQTNIEKIYFNIGLQIKTLDKGYDISYLDDYKGGSWVISNILRTRNPDSYDPSSGHYILSSFQTKDGDICMENKFDWDNGFELMCEDRYGYSTTSGSTTTSAATTTTSQESDGKICAFTDDFKRQCDDAVGVPRLETAQECLEECQKHPHCDKAHWHPGNQIWEDDSRAVCFMFGVGSATCDWNGGEGPDGHPGAKMIQCDAPTCSLEYGYEPNLCKSGKNGAYCDYDEDYEKASCYSCEFMKTPRDCSDSNDEDESTCLQEYSCLRELSVRARTRTRTPVCNLVRFRPYLGKRCSR